MKEADKDARTVFVRNINFGIDEAKLEDRFADIGPVRQCFLVRNRGEEQHRGFGFVQYAIPEDADRAVQELDGADLHGRKLKVRIDLAVIHQSITVLCSPQLASCMGPSEAGYTFPSTSRTMYASLGRKTSFCGPFTGANGISSA